MPESVHDRIAARAEKLERLIEQVAAAAASDDAPAELPDRPVGDVGPTWTGGWTN